MRAIGTVEGVSLMKKKRRSKPGQTIAATEGAAQLQAALGGEERAEDGGDEEVAEAHQRGAEVDELEAGRSAAGAAPFSTVFGCWRRSVATK